MAEKEVELAEKAQTEEINTFNRRNTHFNRKLCCLDFRCMCIIIIISSIVFVVSSSTANPTPSRSLGRKGTGANFAGASSEVLQVVFPFVLNFPLETEPPILDESSFAVEIKFGVYSPLTSRVGFSDRRLWSHYTDTSEPGSATGKYCGHPLSNPGLEPATSRSLAQRSAN